MATSFADIIRKGAQTVVGAVPKAAAAAGVPINTAALPQNKNAPNYVSITDPITGKTLSVKPAGQGGYLNAYEAYANSANEQANRQQQYLNQTLQQNNATTNANFDSAQRQAYVDYMRKQKNLGGQLAALGVNGGASETGQLNLYNNYGSSHAATEQQRAAELAANQRSRDDAWNEYYENLQTDLREKQQTAINNQINEYNNEITRFSSSVAQYPTTEKGYKSYKKWIEKLKNSNDPLKDIKIGLVRQQMATQFPDGKPKGGGSGGGGGGGGSRRRSGGYSSGSGGGGGSETSAGSGYSSNTRAAYEARSGKSSKKKSKTKSIKGDTYRVTKKGSYRSR